MDPRLKHVPSLCRHCYPREFRREKPDRSECGFRLHFCRGCHWQAVRGPDRTGHLLRQCQEAVAHDRRAGTAVRSLLVEELISYSAGFLPVRTASTMAMAARTPA